MTIKTLSINEDRESFCSATDEDPGGVSSEFREELRNLINRHSLECLGGHTPDFLIADYLVDCLMVFGRAVGQRAAWYGAAEDRQASGAEGAPMPSTPPHEMSPA